MSDRDLRAAVDAAQQVSVSIMGSDGHVRVGFLTEAGAGFVVQRILEALDEREQLTPEADDQCLTCGEYDARGQPYAQGECPRSQRECGHHCNCSWVHDCCHWCGAEMDEGGEYQVGAVVAYFTDGEPHLAWREPSANQQNRHRWHVFHGLAFGWRTWDEIARCGAVRFLGVHPSVEQEQP